MRHRWSVVAAALAAVGALASTASAQTVFDNMKCYNIKEKIRSKTYTADLAPKLTHDFSTQIGDRLVGGYLKKGCRLRTPAKLFCTDVAAENAHDAVPPYTPTQWVIPGPESGDRLCYKLTCPVELPKDLDVIDPFGTRTITLRGRTAYFCTPVVRQNSSTDPCDMAGNGQCGGVCDNGKICLATSPSGCECVEPETACTSSTVCGEGHCGGVWETCGTLPNGSCGCMHPPS